MSERWQIKMLGGLRAERGAQIVTGFGASRRGLLLAYLATRERDTQISRETLAECLWPGKFGAGQTREALHCLSVELHRLGVSLGAGEPDDPARADLLVIGSKLTIALVPDAYETDVAQFEAAVWAARRAKDAAEIPALQKAIDLYHGAFLAQHGKADSSIHWIAPARRRLHTAFLETVNRLVPLLEAQGGAAPALAPALRLAEADRFDADAQTQALRLALRSEQQATAASLIAPIRHALGEDALQTILRHPALALSSGRIADLLRHSGSLTSPPASSERAGKNSDIAARILALPPELRFLLCALSRFQGAFTDAEARTVSAAPDTASGLAALAAQKWVTMSQTGYTLTAPVRAAAASLLDEAARGAIYERHARFCLERAQAASAEWATRHAGGSEQTRLKALAADVGLALEWCLEQSGQEALGAALAGAMAPLWAEARQFDTARRWTERAWQRIGTTPLEPGERYALLRARALAARDAGDWKGALRWYRSYLGEATRQPAIGYVVEGLLHLGIDAHHAEQDALAQQAFTSCLSLAEQQGMTEAVVSAQMNWATSLFVTGQVEEAQARFEAALRQARSVPNDLLLAEVLGQMGELWMRLGRFDAARALFNESLQLRIDLDASTALAECRRRLGALCCEQNHLAEATSWLRQAEAVYTHIGDAPSRAAVWGYYGDIALRRGQIAEARDWYGRGLAVWEEQKHGRWQALFRARRARAAWLAGDTAAARADCEDALPLCGGSRALTARAQCLRVLAHLAQAGGDTQEARTRFQEAQNAAAQGGHWRCSVEMLETGATLCGAAGDGERALALSGAAETYRCAANAAGFAPENALHAQARDRIKAEIGTMQGEAAWERGRQAAQSLLPARCVEALSP